MRLIDLTNHRTGIVRGFTIVWHNKKIECLSVAMDKYQIVRFEKTSKKAKTL